MPRLVPGGKFIVLRTGSRARRLPQMLVYSDEMRPRRTLPSLTHEVCFTTRVRFPMIGRPHGQGRTASVTVRSLRPVDSPPTSPPGLPALEHERQNTCSNAHHG